MTATQLLKPCPASVEDVSVSLIRVDSHIQPPHDVQYYRDFLSRMEVGQSFEIPAYAREIVRRASKDLNCKIQTATHNGKPRVWLASLPSSPQTVDIFLAVLKAWANGKQSDVRKGTAVELSSELNTVAWQSSRRVGRMLTKLSTSNCGVDITHLDVKRGNHYRLNLAVLKSQ